MIKNRNVSIITDENNNQIVIINDKKFKGLSKDDWQQIEKYLKGYISDCYEITETNDVVYIGKEFPSEYAGSKRDRKSTRLNSSHPLSSRMPSSA